LSFFPCFGGPALDKNDPSSLNRTASPFVTFILKFVFTKDRLLGSSPLFGWDGSPGFHYGNCRARHPYVLDLSGAGSVFPLKPIWLFLGGSEGSWALPAEVTSGRPRCFLRTWTSSSVLNMCVEKDHSVTRVFVVIRHFPSGSPIFFMRPPFS